MRSRTRLLPLHNDHPERSTREESHDLAQIHWMARQTDQDRQEIFFRIHDRFTDSENVVQGDLHMQIPRNFNLVPPFLNPALPPSLTAIFVRL